MKALTYVFIVLTCIYMVGRSIHGIRTRGNNNHIKEVDKASINWMSEKPADIHVQSVNNNVKVGLLRAITTINRLVVEAPKIKQSEVEKFLNYKTRIEREAYARFYLTIISRMTDAVKFLSSLHEIDVPHEIVMQLGLMMSEMRENLPADNDLLTVHIAMYEAISWVTYRCHMNRHQHNLQDVVEALEYAEAFFVVALDQANKLAGK